jgi:hypothetical protein
MLSGKKFFNQRHVIQNRSGEAIDKKGSSKERLIPEFYGMEA